VRRACSLFRASFEALRGVDFVPLLWAEFEQLACFFFEDDDSDDDGNSGDDDLLRGPASLTEELRSARVCLPRVRRAFFLLFGNALLSPCFFFITLTTATTTATATATMSSGREEEEEEEEWRRSALFYLLKSVRRAASYFSLSATSWLMGGLRSRFSLLRTVCRPGVSLAASSSTRSCRAAT
jgi:hypothetical protein